MKITYVFCSIIMFIQTMVFGGEIPQPVLHLPLDKDTGSAEIQTSMKVRDQLQDKSLFVAGVCGSAFSCGGCGQYGYFLKYAEPPFKENMPFTITCWLKLRQAQWLTRLFYYKDTWRAPSGFCVRVNGTQILLYVYRQSELIAVSSSKDNPLLQNTWYFLAITWNGENWSMYVNGIEAQKGTREAQFFKYPGSKTALNIGGYNINTNNVFQGLIDEVKIYDIALTKDQILSLLEKEIGE